MPPIPGARERARAEVLAAIDAEARRQLGVDGAPGLSLRAIARALGMVSSGIYRYVASRDELLTRLIIEAYDAVGAAAERSVAASSGKPPARRLQLAAQAIRTWAHAHPHEWALLYGSPVPGYQAPEDTIAPATRVSLALISIVTDAHRDGRITAPTDEPEPLPRGLAQDAARLREALGTDLPDEVVVRLLATWSQVLGLVSLELFGQTRNVIDDGPGLLEATTARMAGLLGLPTT